MKKQSYLKAGAVAIILLLIIAGIFVLVPKKNKDQNSTCSTNNLKTVGQSIKTDKNTASLKQAVAAIKATKNYQNDASCMYAVTSYDVIVNRIPDALKDFNIFDAKYKNQIGVSSNLGLATNKGSTVPNTLFKKITALEAKNQDDGIQMSPTLGATEK